MFAVFAVFAVVAGQTAPGGKCGSAGAGRPAQVRCGRRGREGRGSGRRRRGCRRSPGVAAIGAGAGFWLTRSVDDQEARAGSAGTGGGASPAPSAAARRPQPVGIWPLDEASWTVARDTVGGDNGTATDVQWRSGKDGAARFDGKSSQIVTAGPALRTGPGRSFTVAAWVCLSAEPGFFATALSQEAADNSGFYLQYSSAEKRWAFARPDLRAVGYTVPAVDTWTHIVGVCDGPARKLRLYVNGVQEAAIDDTNRSPPPARS